METVSEVPEENYFDAARLSRQEARDEALAILQATVDDPNADEAAIASASEHYRHGQCDHHRVGD